MKKFSTQILLSYLFIIICLIVGNFLFFYSIRLYFIHEVKSDVFHMLEFSEHEIRENRHKNPLKIISEIFNEIPKDSSFSTFITFKGKIYSPVSSNSKKTAVKTSLFNNFIFINDKYLLEKNVSVNQNLSFNVKIIKDMTELKITLINIFEKMVLFLSLLLILIIMLIHRIYSKTLKQLETLKRVTNSVAIDSFQTEIDRKEFYSEFYNIITAYEAMQHRLKKQSELQIDFINSASHELKTPIFIISGYISLIASGKITDKKLLTESIEAIKHETKDMGILVEKLLFIAKQDNLKLDMELFSINELINEITEEIQIIYDFNKFNIIGNNIEFYSDRKLLKQLLRNIIDNSVKYGSGKKVDIYISKFDTVKISVQDYGIGIKAEEINHIFNKFYRASNNSSKHIKGHGLGLSISQAIADALGATLSISSTYSKGSMVTIVF